MKAIVTTVLSLASLLAGGEGSIADFLVVEHFKNIDTNVRVDRAESENCTEYGDQGFECVPYYQCQNGTIITDHTYYIQIGFPDLHPAQCPGFLDVCCQDPDFIPPPPPQNCNEYGDQGFECAGAQGLK